MSLAAKMLRHHHVLNLSLGDPLKITASIINGIIKIVHKPGKTVWEVFLIVVHSIIGCTGNPYPFFTTIRNKNTVVLVVATSPVLLNTVQLAE